MPADKVLEMRNQILLPINFINILPNLVSITFWQYLSHDNDLFYAMILSGNYFANHFIMGGERFETPHPETYLFGDNTDLNFFGGRPVPVSQGYSQS